MMILSWNCRGLGNPRAVKALSRLVKQKRPSLVFLMETKLRQTKMEQIRCTLGYNGLFVVDSIGRSGGLALFWSEEINVEIQNFSQYHINGVIRDQPNHVPWKFTGFYGHPEMGKRHESWCLLKILARFSPLPWVCIGDFNEILFPSEKWGGNTRSRRLMWDFQQALEECDLTDLGFLGPKYTWNNGREEEDFIKERLDRGVANHEWRDLFPNAELRVEFALGSDHLPVFLCLKGEIGRRNKVPIFRYEASWALEEEYGAVQNRRNPLSTINRLKKELLNIQGNEGAASVLEAKKIMKELQLLTDQEDIRWSQRAKVTWLKNRDKNTRFYHECANARKRKNFIGEILDETGQEWNNTEKVEMAFVTYFSRLFSAGEQGDMEQCLQHLSLRVTREMNTDLLKEFSKDEISTALMQMGPLKAPSPDGFTTGFFQKHWSTMGDEVCNVVLDILNSGKMPDELNSTHIVLIPKVKNPSCVTEFRPISLCNVIYKLVSKVLANRLKRVLPLIISLTQSAFIPGRLISDNILAAYETLHTMHTGMKGKKGFMSVKLDMSKAYDRVEWSFLEAVMRRMGANIVQRSNLTNILRVYEVALGQKLNQDKTAIFFSNNTRPIDRDSVLELAGIPASQRYDTYLGLPALVGKSRTIAFRHIIDRVRKRLNDWKLKFLSQARKEILLKAVVQAIPTYCMSVFRLPKSLCSEINSLMQKFWWGHKEKDKRIAWMSWSRMGLSKKRGGMGFRDFTCFNTALLAKQCWRIWKVPDSFVAKILKAKYFQESSILEAPLGRKPSFAWQSIHSSCGLLREGLIWKVGCGEKIRIWHDRWIPQPHSFKVQSKPSILAPTATMKELLDDDTGGWNHNLVNQIFSPEEAQLILSLPLSGSRQEDALIWRGTAKGVFSVRNAYHIQKELDRVYQAESSCGGPSSAIWVKLWKLQIPNVEKNFLWRACNEILPTRANLYRRHIIENPKCLICELEDETVVHILWNCPSAADVWGARERVFQKSSLCGRTFFQLAEEMFARCDREEIIQFAGLARRIWLRRNEVVHGGQFTSPAEVIRATLSAILEYNAANVVGGILSNTQRSIRWEAPPVGWILANWDASINKQQGWWGMGMILRDSRGRMIAAKSSFRLGVLDPTVAEAIAALEAIWFCNRLGYDWIQFVGDAKVVVQAVLSDETDWSPTGHIIEAIKTEIRSFSHWQMLYVQREANHIAHVLAREASKQCMENEWFNDPPDCIKDLLVLEQDVPVILS
ncbi:uncharacterized protein LOC132181841 [Corylus avellana]|uniref:uncharacterized protein LOC132181841 n=1 Tax=Corylus avellana TaxID=13451 RepID=UPI00286BE964|nr:uncharacterized protein LOC132181841 [Corylus avellana]